MTGTQAFAVFTFSFFAAIFHTHFQLKWARFVRRQVEINLEIYKAQLENAKNNLEVLIKLQDEKRLVVRRWSAGPDHYVKFCKEVVDNCIEAERVTSDSMKYCRHDFDRRAHANLKKFIKHIGARIHEMEEVIRTTK